MSTVFAQPNQAEIEPGSQQYFSSVPPGHVLEDFQLRQKANEIILVVLKIHYF